MERKMGNISFTQGIYSYSDSFLHKLDPRSKIIGTLLLITSVLSGFFFSFDVSFREYFLIFIISVYQKAPPRDSGGTLLP